MFVYLEGCNGSASAWRMERKNLPFTLLEVNDSIWAFEAMPCTVHSTNASRRVTLKKLGVGLVHGVKGQPTCIDLTNRRSEAIMTALVTKIRTSAMRFFEAHSARCVLSDVSAIIYARLLERGGSVKPRSFCLSLKLASIERYRVLIQLGRNGQPTAQHAQSIPLLTD